MFNKNPSIYQKLITCVLVTSIFFFIAYLFDRSSIASKSQVQRNTVTDQLDSKVSTINSTSEVKYVSKNIEDIKIFDNVVGRNPDIDNNKRLSMPLPDPETWRVATIETGTDVSSRCWIKLAREKKWFDFVGATVGNIFHLELPEMGIVGDAKVISIEKCPPIKHIDRPIVTGTFCREIDSNVKILRIECSDETLVAGTTGNHPFWSEDRHTFIPAEKLFVGEHVKTINGTVEIVSVTARDALPCEKVYNIEVYGEHVYHVTKNGILVHNFCMPADEQLKEYAGFAAMHSWWKHAKEFPSINRLKYEDAVSALSDLAYEVLTNPTEQKVLSTLREIYFDANRNVIVIVNKENLGMQSTIFKGDRATFDRIIKENAQSQ